VAGEHVGRFAHYYQDLTHGPDGYPELVQVRTRDADNLTLTLRYSDIRPSRLNGGR
jgi:hypothetical protein